MSSLLSAPRILLFADHRFRDAPVLSAIKVEIERLVPALDVRVISFDLWQPSIELFKPHIVVLNHLHGKRNQTIAEWIKRHNGKVVILPTEGRPNTYDQMVWAANEWPHKLCDLYLCWSSVMAGMIEDVVVEVVGCPRFDFYTTPLRSLIQFRADALGRYDLDPELPVITVASSFPQSKFHKRQRDFNEQDWKDLKITGISGRENPSLFAEQEYESLETFRLMVRGVSADYQVIVKPHPAEDIIEWKQVADDAGFRVMESDYIWNLLAMSDLHIARSSCMTLCEAWMMNVQTIGIPLGFESFKPGAACEVIDLTPISLTSIEVESSQLVDTVEDLLVNDGGEDKLDQKERRDRYISTWFTPKDIAGSCSVIAGRLLELLGSPLPDDRLSIGDDVQLSQIVSNHSKNLATPTFDHIGQYNKAVTQLVVNEWVSRIKSL